MDNRSLELILHKTGEKFLQYLLNHKATIHHSKTIDEYHFNAKQLETLRRLSSIIEQCEKILSNNPHSSMKQCLFGNGGLFNLMRKQCGGEIPEKKSSEELLQHLYNKAIEFYPSFLLTDTNSFYAPPTLAHYFLPSSKEDKHICNLLSKHPHLKAITTSDNSFNTLSYKLSNNSSVICFLSTFTGDFIQRAFLNCCYRMKYDLGSLLEEIESQYYILESIAKGEAIEMSFFCGIYGLKLADVDEYQVTENITLRNINEHNNPGIENTISIATTPSHTNAIVGCTLEYKTRLNSSGKVNNSDYPITEDNQFIDKIFDNLIQSHILGLHSTYPPIKITFFDRGLPLCPKFPQLPENYQTSIAILNLDQLEVIKEWFALLSSIEAKYISLTLSRIKTAIYNRLDPIDSILDAFIAWESMFSSKISTTNSVVKSIGKVLSRAGYVISKRKLDELYSLRSSIVHGNPNEHKLLISKSPEQKAHEMEEVKKQTIDIAITVLKELIKDDKLLEKTPEERVEILLNPVLVVCDKCETKKYSFE